MENTYFDGLIKPSYDAIFPTGAGLNQDEYILVEYPGIIHAESEEIFYGLEGFPVLEHYPFNKYHTLLTYPQAKIYKEIAFYRPRDLLIYLNDGIEMEPDEIQFALEYCKENYSFGDATPLSFSKALAKLLEQTYVKKVSIAFPSQITMKDIYYIGDILPDQLLDDKVEFIFNGDGLSPVEFLKTALCKQKQFDPPYTTVVTNEIDFIYDVLSSFEEYEVYETFFLLRNHSKNVSLVEENGEIKFIEQGTDKIINILNPIKKRLINGLPLPLKAKFGRFSPVPYVVNEPHNIFNFTETERRP